MSIEGILFFGSIIISYFVGMWAGMKIEKPKVVKKTKKVVSPVKPSHGSVIPSGSIAAKASARDSAKPKPKTKVRN